MDANTAKKISATILAAFILFGFAVAFATAKVLTIPDVLEVVETKRIDCHENGNCIHEVKKIVDNNNGVVCYTVSSVYLTYSYPVSISCVK